MRECTITTENKHECPDTRLFSLGVSQFTQFYDRRYDENTLREELEKINDLCAMRECPFLGVVEEVNV